MNVIDRNEILARSSVVYGEERLKNPDFVQFCETGGQRT